jgi:hypothetical protein
MPSPKMLLHSKFSTVFLYARVFGIEGERFNTVLNDKKTFFRLNV